VWRWERRCAAASAGRVGQRFEPVRRFGIVSFDAPIASVASGRQRHINDCDIAPVPTNSFGSHASDFGKATEPADERMVPG